MSNKSMTAISVVAIVLALVSIGYSATSNTQQSVDPQIRADIDSVTADMDKVLEIEGNSVLLFVKIVDRLDAMEVQLNGTMTAEDVARYNADLLVLQNAVNTVGENIIDVPTHESTAEDFNLVLLNVQSEVQEIFGLNDVVYVTGDATATIHPTVSLKIRDSDGSILAEKEFGIPNEGRFTSIYQVPDLNPGIYTITVTDSTIVDSISFEVQ